MMLKKHILSRPELEVLGLLLGFPESCYSIRRLSKEVGMDYSNVHKALAGLKERKLIRFEDIGNVKTPKVDYCTPDVLSLSMAAINRAVSFLSQDAGFSNLLRKIREKLAGHFFVLLLFGSRARGHARKGSDYDLLFIAGENEDISLLKEKIAIELQSDAAGKNIDFDIVPASSFSRMLNERDTVGREAYEANIILHGAGSYISMVKEYDKLSGHQISNIKGKIY